MGRVTERHKAVHLRAGAVSSRPETLTPEEPLEIRLDAVCTTPRRPVHDTPPVRVDPGLASLPDRFRAAQRVVDRAGGLRGHSMNVYAGEDRVTLAAAAVAQG